MGTYSNQDVLTGNDHPGISKKIKKPWAAKDGIGDQYLTPRFAIYKFRLQDLQQKKTSE